MQMMLRAVGPPPQGMGTITAHASFDFLRTFTYPATVRVTHIVLRVGRSSLEFEVVLARNDTPQTPHARGRTVVVWMDYVAGTAAPWPQAVLEGFWAYLSAAP